MRKGVVSATGLAALIVVLAGVPGSSADRPGLSGGVPVYRLKKLAPAGFDVYQGILDWTPVSETKAIAFARNRAMSPRTYSLFSYAFAKTGACSAPRILEDKKGAPMAAACVWFGAGGGGDRAGKPYGLVFGLFIEDINNFRNAAIYVAKFDSAGGRIGGWRLLLDLPTPEGWYLAGESLYASRNENSVGIVPTFVLYKPTGYRARSQVYFIEVDTMEGNPIGDPTQLLLPDGGQNVECLGFTPAWNGTSWLAPVRATFCQPNVERWEVLKNKLLVGVISGGQSHAAVLKEIAADKVAVADTYAAVLAPLPESAAYLALFVRHRTLIPEAERQLDLFKYDFSLKRLDVKGRVVKTTPVLIPAPDHQLAYDPLYVPSRDQDDFSKAVAKDGTIWLSRAHTIEIMRKGSAASRRQEQEVDFYAVDLSTGAVKHKARTVSVWNSVLWYQPLIGVFPGGPVAVVNGLYHIPSPYAWDNYLTLFAD
jgi:hypothetical protein